MCALPIFVLLDRILAHYGPAAEESRHTLREVVAGLLDRIWPQERAHGSPPPPELGDADGLYEGIEQLAPQDDAQRSLKNNALNVATDIGKPRCLMYARQSPPIPAPFLGTVAVC